MKKFFLILINVGTLVFMLSGCQDDVSTDTKNVSESVKNALKIMSRMQKLERMGLSSPSVTNEKVGIKRQISAHSMPNTDSLELEQSEWITCAQQQYVETDENYTWVLDYGEQGCMDGEFFMKGKMVETYSETDGIYTSTIVYTNFGDESYIMSGKTIYTGSYEWPENVEDSISYSGFFEYSEDLQITCTEHEKTETYMIISSGKEKYDEKGFITEKEYSKIQFENGDTYERSIEKPLLYSFACESEDDTPTDWIFTYVAGVESNVYKEKGQEGQFSIDYGAGTCDNIITITEKEETYQIDLSKDLENEVPLF